MTAAPGSSAGKTLVTLALLRAFARRGVRVQPFKVGPDYIDPAFLAAAAGRPCPNLDGWAMREASLDGLIAELGRDADLVLGEGVMGLFDGAPGGGGSTAELARRTGWPVVLVVNAKGMGASAAALVAGFARHREGVDVVGVVFNRVGGARHAALLTEACGALDGVRVLGALPRDDGLVLPSRHLGLVQAIEHATLETVLERAADLAEAHLDLAGVLALARPTRVGAARAALGMPPPGQRIALAADAAFAFAYPAQVAAWRAAGAEVVPFSPLTGAGPDPDADAVVLPGGYPELHGGRLAANYAFLDGLRRAVRRGAAVYGECGGYMVLGEALIDGDGARHAMAGLLPLVTSFAERRLHLGYRAAVVATDSPIGAPGSAFRGHEFHYATIVADGGAPLFRAADATGRDLGPTGGVVGRVCGSFLHLIDRAEA